MVSVHSQQQFEFCVSLPSSLGYKDLVSLQYLLDEEIKKFEQLLCFPLDFFVARTIEDVRVRFAERKSPLQEWLKSLKDLPPHERKGAGAKIHELKTKIEAQLPEFLGRWRDYDEQRSMSHEIDDITLPLPRVERGRRHPISAVTQELLKLLQRMGFAVIDGPEIDREYYNFDTLNIPKTHPAREMQDTFFFSPEWLLRTQTSNVQSHAMLERSLPLKIVCPGYVYRNELDLTHVPAFRQLECLVVDKNIHFGNLRHTINCFFNEFFGKSLNMRLRSSYFPFTEPSAEVDLQCPQCEGRGCRTCKHTGWLEMGGCGLVHRDVFIRCNIDPDVYSGFAFGMGIDRLTMIKYAVSDLRSMLDGDLRFLRDFW